MTQRKGLLALLIFTFLLIAVVLVVLLGVGQKSSFFGQADSGGQKLSVSIENSYVFASPLSALANNQDKIRITVFVLNGEGLGVENKQVNLIVPDEITVEVVASFTDNYGKALFNISTGVAGEYYIAASVNNHVFPQQVRISFK